MSQSYDQLLGAEQRAWNRDALRLAAVLAVILVCAYTLRQRRRYCGLLCCRFPGHLQPRRLRLKVPWCGRKRMRLCSMQSLIFR